MYPEQVLVFDTQSIDQYVMKWKIHPERKDGRSGKKNDPEPPVVNKTFVFIKGQLQKKSNTMRKQVYAVILDEGNKITPVAGKVEKVWIKIIQVDDDAKHQYHQ